MQASDTPAMFMQDNCWQAADDDFALVFSIAQLQGVFRKALRVPFGSRALIIQNGQSTEVPCGEYELEGFFARLNNLLRDQAADVLITRQAPCVLQFSFDDLPSAEFLPLSCVFSCAIKIEQIAAFARHFMRAAGSIKRADLENLLAAPMRQVVAEFLASQALPEMAANPQLRLQLDERLQSMLKIRLAQYGLALLQVETLELRHDKFDAQRQKLGSLVLVLAEQRAQIALNKQFAELYDASEWQQIAAQRGQIERQLQQQQLQEQANSDAKLLSAEQQLQEQERLQVLRSRKIELLGRILSADSEQQALKLGARDSLRELEHGHASKAMARLDTVQGWQQMRALAEIKMHTELEIARQTAREQLALQQQRFALQIAQLQQQQAQERERAAQELQLDAIEREANRRAAQTRQAKAQAHAEQCEQQLRSQQQQTRHILLQLQLEAKQREAALLADWEQQLQLQKQRALLREDALQDANQSVKLADLAEQAERFSRTGEQANTLLQQEKLRATLALQEQFQQQQLAQHKQKQAFELDQREREMRIRQQEQELIWQRQSQQAEREQQERSARWQAEQEQQLALARLEMTRMGVMGNLNDMAKLAVAPAANAALIAEVMKTQLHANMQASQISASQGGLDANQVEQKLTQERNWRENLAEQERQHQLALLGLQTAGANAGLSKLCLQGHRNVATAGVCVEWGGALS